ncbi:MAG: MATE family efflux transporter [Eubacteriaceae bacterium]|jgi:multidrug efflux pump|nr:MATE family efflux transporter [Eubacteriaceae bacterium]MDD4507653.1 MATE family efflux transporter [Eubacteriaceae bacterium]
MNQSLEQYNAMPVLKSVVKNALPAVLSMLMVLIYNLADTFFIGQTGDALQVAAVSLATPVFLVFMSLGNVFGIGGTSVISRAFGKGKKEYAKKVCSFCMWSCVAIGLVISVGFLVFMDPLLKLIGASADTWDFTQSYLTIVSFCGVFALCSSCFSNVLRAEGQATRAMVGQIVGNVLNMVLDAVFIMVFNWGVVGCALATLIGETVGALYYFLFYLRGKSSLGVNIKNFTVKEGVAGSVFAIGIPASLGSLLMSVSQIIMNSQMASYGDMALAGIGVAMKVGMITGMISMGIGQGMQPLLGYCVGAKNWDRFKSYMKVSFIFATVIGTSLTALCYAFDNQIVSLILTEPNAFDDAVQFVRILICTGPLFGIYYMFINALQAMGASMPSLIINISRQGLLYIPMLFILNAVLGMTGLVWAQPVVDILSFVMGLVMYVVYLRRMMRRGVAVKA